MEQTTGKVNHTHKRNYRTILLVLGLIAYSVFMIIATSLLTQIYQTDNNIRHQSSQSNQLALITPEQPTPIPPANAQIDIQNESSSPNPALNSTESAQVILHGSRAEKKIALTFDAEMTWFMKNQVLSGRVKTSYDKRITDTLIATHTKATFFLTGMWISLYPDDTTTLSQNPLFELGSHSFTDSSFNGKCYGLTPLSKADQIAQVGSTEFLLKLYAGIDNRLFRFPGGCYSDDSLKLIKKADDIVVHWDVAGGDGFNNDTQSIVNSVVNQTQNGSIILLHMNGAPTAPKTADALSDIIKILKQKGFEFVKVSELLNLPPVNDAS